MYFTSCNKAYLNLSFSHCIMDESFKFKYQGSEIIKLLSCSTNMGMSLSLS